jgi:hypothetical protein
MAYIEPNLSTSTVQSLGTKSKQINPKAVVRNTLLPVTKYKHYTEWHEITRLFMWAWHSLYFNSGCPAIHNEKQNNQNIKSKH